MTIIQYAKWAFTTRHVNHIDVSIIEKTNLKELKMNIANSKIKQLLMLSPAKASSKKTTSVG